MRTHRTIRRVCARRSCGPHLAAVLFAPLSSTVPGFLLGLFVLRYIRSLSSDSSPDCCSGDIGTRCSCLGASDSPVRSYVPRSLRAPQAGIAKQFEWTFATTSLDLDRAALVCALASWTLPRFLDVNFVPVQARYLPNHFLPGFCFG